MERLERLLSSSAWRVIVSILRKYIDISYLIRLMQEPGYAEAEIRRELFLIHISIFRLLAILCIDIVTSLNKKKASIKYRSETIAVLVLWCSGDIESNPGPPCDDLRDFCKKMISLLVIRYWESTEGKRYWESTEGKQQSSADYKKLPDGWPEDAWFGDPSKCNKPERDKMLNILLDTCTQQCVDVPNDWLSIAEKYRHTLDKNCGKTEKERIAGELRVWVKNLRSKEIVEQTFNKLLDVPVQDKNLIIAQIFDKLKKHVPDLHSDMLGSQTVTEKNNVDLLVHNLEYDEQTAESTSLNPSNPSGKVDATQTYGDSNPAMINDTTILKSSMYQMPSHSLERNMLHVHTSMLSAENTNSTDHDKWLDDIIVDSLSSNFTNEKVFSPSDYFKNFDQIEQNNDYTEQNNDYIEQIFDNIGHVDDTCRNKANHNKRKRTIEIGDDMRPPLAKHSAMSVAQITGCFEGAPRLDTERTLDGDTTLDDITQVTESDANYLDLLGLKTFQ